MVQVAFRGELARLAGTGGMELEAGSVAEVLRAIRARDGAQARREAGRMLITVNQKSVTLLKGCRTPLSEGDVVAFLPICGGG